MRDVNHAIGRSAGNCMCSIRSTTSTLAMLGMLSSSSSSRRDSCQTVRPSPDRKLENGRGRTPGLATAPGEATAELRALEQFLAHLPGRLKPGARVPILTFHSGEDRRVKKAFHAAHRDGLYERIAANPIRPSPEARRANRPRSAIRIPRSGITRHSNQQVMP